MNILTNLKQLPCYDLKGFACWLAGWLALLNMFCPFKKYVSSQVTAVDLWCILVFPNVMCSRYVGTTAAILVENIGTSPCNTSGEHRVREPWSMFGLTGFCLDCL